MKFANDITSIPKVCLECVHFKNDHSCILIKDDGEGGTFCQYNPEYF